MQRANWVFLALLSSVWFALPAHAVKIAGLFADNKGHYFVELGGTLNGQELPFLRFSPYFVGDAKGFHQLHVWESITADAPTRYLDYRANSASTIRLDGKKILIQAKGKDLRLSPVATEEWRSWERKIESGETPLHVPSFSDGGKLLLVLQRGEEFIVGVRHDVYYEELGRIRAYSDTVRFFRGTPGKWTELGRTYDFMVTRGSGNLAFFVTSTGTFSLAKGMLSRQPDRESWFLLRGEQAEPWNQRFFVSYPEEFDPASLQLPDAEPVFELLTPTDWFETESCPNHLERGRTPLG